MPQDRKSINAQEASGRLTGMPSSGYSPVVDWMQKNGIEVTRENYLGLAYPEGLPRPWTAEDEEGLPASLQDWAQFER